MLLQVFLNLLKKINIASVFYHTANIRLHFTLPLTPMSVTILREKREQYQKPNLENGVICYKDRNFQGNPLGLQSKKKIISYLFS